MRVLLNNQSNRKKMKAIIKLTDQKNNSVLIGINSIIDITTITSTENSYVKKITKVRSIGAMVTTNYVMETVEEIYKIINS